VYTPPQVVPTAREAKPEDLTIEQLLDAVEKFREQKAEIEKKDKGVHEGGASEGGQAEGADRRAGWCLYAAQRPCTGTPAGAKLPARADAVGQSMS
jgi:hypothetical protein